MNWEKIFAKETPDKRFRALDWKISLAELKPCVPRERTGRIPPSAFISTIEKVPCVLG